MTTHAIAVIGAGASGTLLALHLLRRAPPGTRVTLIDRNAPFGPGLAYATGSANHLLNVPAGRMSAFADQPRHFLDWLERQSAQLLGGIQPTEAGFVPRRLYGAYLRHLLNSEAQNPALDTLHDSVTAIDGTVLRLASGRTISADLVVLATGNDRPASPRGVPAVQTSPCWRADPWVPSAFGALDAHAPVLLIGTGLTMVDALITLVDQGHTGPIHAVSRRGLLPRPHGGGAPVVTAATGAADRAARADTPGAPADGCIGRSLAWCDRCAAAVHPGNLAVAVGGGSPAFSASSASVVGCASASHAAIRRRADRRRTCEWPIAHPRRPYRGLCDIGPRHECAALSS